MTSDLNLHPYTEARVLNRLVASLNPGLGALWCTSPSSLSTYFLFLFQLSSLKEVKTQKVVLKVNQSFQREPAPITDV